MEGYDEYVINNIRQTQEVDKREDLLELTNYTISECKKELNTIMDSVNKINGLLATLETVRGGDSSNG